MTTPSLSWTQQYALAVAAADAATANDASKSATSSSSSSHNSNSRPSDGVQRFLASALAAASSAESPLSLAAVGAQLLVPVAQLGTAQLQKEHQLDRDAVLRVLQLQVVCRLFCCCADGATTGSSAKKKKKKSEKKQDAARLKALKKETRSLLDRIALLLDAANPPSLTDEDEHSPFHEFLQEVLAKAFATRLPKFTRFLLGVYELEDESRELEGLALSSPLPLVAPVIASKPAQAAQEADMQAPLAPQSILSALRDEQRPLKRSRTEAAVPFKKMQLPSELRRRSSFPSTRRDLTSAVAKAATAADSSSSTNSSSRTTSNAAGAAANSASASSTGKPSSKARRSVSSGVKNPVTSAEKPRLAHHVSLGAKPTTLLRNVDRALFAGPQSRFAPSASNKTPHTLTVVTNSSSTRPLSAQRQSPLLANAPLSGLQRSLSGPKPPIAPPHTAVSTLLMNERSASVVMRTPDRPQRRQQRASRVLIESSPPFRNPNVGAAARQRKPSSAIPPPQLR